jgi:hypothetical protein
MQKIGFTVNAVIQKPIEDNWPRRSSEDLCANDEPASKMEGVSCYIGHVPVTALEDGRPVPIIVVSLAPQAIGSNCETFLCGGISQRQDDHEHIWLLGASLDLGLREDWQPDRVSNAVQASLPRLLNSGIGLVNDKGAEDPVWMEIETVEKWVCEAIANLKSSEKYKATHG